MRGLIFFVAELANKLFEAHRTAHTRAINTCTTSLLDFLRPAGEVPEWHAQPAADACRRCCVQCRALSLEPIRNGRPLYWKQKPKMRLFQELSSWKPKHFLDLPGRRPCGGHLGDRCIAWRANEGRDSSSERAPAISGTLLPLSTNGP